ncbi:DUF2334 domain-containing protein [Candidatus Gracilibacteria bacterium]|nr:DUF2334 domain-containing protein [Candidatus Gracilibacteria bacterium]
MQNLHFCARNEDIDPNKKYIILRLDDVQSYYLKELTIKMLNEGISRKMPYTVGIIPLNLTEDPEMTRYLRQNKCSIEIAQHGFSHRSDIAEFEDLPESVANKKLNQGLEILNKISNHEIITFIPPENKYSTGTVEAAKKNNFNIISGEGDGLFDYSATSFNFDTDTLNPVDVVIDASKSDAELKGFSIIMLHPQDYIGEDGEEDPIKYKRYIELLDKLESEGFAFTTMHDYYNFIRKTGGEDVFYDSEIKKDKKNILPVVSNDVTSSGTEIINNEITKKNYLKKSKLISIPRWINNYNYISAKYLILQGNISEDNVENVYINEYQLAAFKSGDRKFTYKLNTHFGNLQEGENTYKIYFEKAGVKTFKESIVFYYSQDRAQYDKYTEKLLTRLNNEAIDTISSPKY